LDKKKCEHGYELGPNNEHIFQSKTYDILEHDTGQKYRVTEEGQKYTVTEEQPKLDTNKLLAEARSLIEYNKRAKENSTPAPKPQTKYEKELEQSKKNWNEYFQKYPSKIRYNIFEEIEKALDY
jgi:hypothetical protein